MRKLLLCLLCATLLSGCAADRAQAPPSVSPTASAPAAKPALPDRLSRNSQGVPELSVYVVSEEAAREMDVETYLAGVLAGEMKNDWPLEALKAQAILARTFVMKFVSEKTSKYEACDISTDIEEAQAYNAEGINDRIRTAVQQTKGQVLANGGEFPYTWFHAHSGGMTATAKEGLNYSKEEPGYIRVVKGRDSEKAPEEAQSWTADFTKDEVAAACTSLGGSPGDIDSVSVVSRGDSGRAVTLMIGDAEVNAAELRLALGSTKMRSALLTSLTTSGDTVRIAGKGYGHGVGMPQWGAYQLAEEGMLGPDIVLYYFQDLQLVTLW